MCLLGHSRSADAPGAILDATGSDGGGIGVVDLGCAESLDVGWGVGDADEVVAIGVAGTDEAGMFEGAEATVGKDGIMASGWLVPLESIWCSVFTFLFDSMAA